MPKVKELKSEKGFNKFISNDNSVVIVYHFLCHGCQIYIDDLKKNPEIFSDVNLAKIHMILDWVIDRAELYGDVEEENKFLAQRFGVGNLFPTTLFFKKGELIKKVDGSLNTQQLRNIINDIFELESQ